MPIGFYGVDKTAQITVDQILLLEQAIGYNLKIVKRRILRMCSNFYDAGKTEHPAWEELCRMGLGYRRDAFGRCVYHASDRGIDLVSAVTGVRIYKDPGMWTGTGGDTDGNDI